MRKLLIALLVLGLLGLAADVFARRTAEDQVAGRLQRTFDLESEPSVSLGGWPFLLGLARGEISKIVMTGETVRSEDVTLDDVEVEMRDVRFSPSDVVDGSGRVRASGGQGSAAITQNSLNQALQNAGAPFTLTLSAGGVAASTEGAEARGDVSLDGNALSVGGRGLPMVALDLPSMGGRISYDSVDVKDGRAIVRFTVDALNFSA